MSQVYRALPAAEELRARFIYDQSTGILYLRKTGKPTGTKARERSAHLVVNLGRKLGVAFVHRVIWKMMTGEDAPAQVDHIDNDGSNNRWENLRLANASQNQHNRRSRRCTDLPKGVTANASGFYARIAVDGKQRYLGSYRTAEEAHAAYQKAAKQLHGEFARFS